jgi:diguanylate cyclase (GGDEF)-like protein
VRALVQRAKSRYVIAFFAPAVYLVAYFPLASIFGPDAAALSLLPVGLIAWFFGVRAGVVAGVLALPLNTLLLNLSGHPGTAVLITRSGAPGGLVIVFAGALLGRLSDVHTRTVAQTNDRDRDHALLEGQARILEEIAQGRPLAETLDALARIVEPLTPHAMCAFALVDDSEKRFYLSVAPTLPSSLRDTFETATIASSADPVIAAAQRREPVIAADIDNDGRWAGFRTLARSHNVHAVWAIPAKAAATGRLLGIFALYHTRASAPSAADLEMMERTVALAEIAIERKAFEERLAYQAFHDALTDLPNRDLFIDRLRHAIARASRQHFSHAVLFIDLDDFKAVNDHLGHEAGDQLLVRVGCLLRQCVRPSDTVARWSGDEFVILLEGLEDVQDCQRIAERITACLQPPIALKTANVAITASVGIAVGTSSHQHPDALLREADAAMYRAKRRGKAHHELFDDQLRGVTFDHVADELALRRGIDQGEFRLHYQPIVDVLTGNITGLEALVRWNHPVRGLLGPASFVPLAEETGLIYPLGRWVLGEACKQARSYQHRFGGGPRVMCVNVSSVQLQTPTFSHDVSTLLREADLAPSCLRLEITESLAPGRLDDVSETLDSLRQLGVGLAIDDFGTGHASLHYLKRFAVDSITIERSLVAGVDDNPADAAIVRSVIALAHALGISVTAKGVETAEQLTVLRQLGCDMVQGFRFGKPMSEEPIAILLEATTPPITFNGGLVR